VDYPVTKRRLRSLGGANYRRLPEVGNWEVTVRLRRMWDSHREYLKFFHFLAVFQP
jgi:hypothetical protein